MKKNAKQGRFCSKAAFTLIELLVVVLIIGILAAVALPQYRVAVAKSRYAKLKHMVRALAQAEEAYYLANGSYATNMEDLDVEIPNGTLDSEWEWNPVSKLYLYDWGSCQLVNLETDKRVMCVDDDINMGYRKYLHHSPTFTDLQGCDVRGTLDETDYRVSICKTESGNVPRGEYAPSLIQFWNY